MTSKIFSINVILFALILITFTMTSGFSFAQSSTNQWSPYQRVPGYSDDTYPPYMIADQNNTVHAFVSQWVGQENPSLAVVYRKWSWSDGWSPPVDILLSPEKQARLMGALLDQTGEMHVIFYGGDQMGGNIYYSRAPAINADQVHAWSLPVLVGMSAIDPSSAALAGDINGNLVIIYSGNLEGNGIYAVTSSDDGLTWSDPTNIFSTNSTALWPYNIQLYPGKSGYLHAVWNVVDPLGHNKAGYYARLDLKTNQWSIPLQFDKNNGGNAGGGIAFPTVIEFKNEIFIMYNNGIPPGGVPVTQWFVRSFDGGKTWTIPIRISQRHEGRNGVSTFVIDGNDVLHAIFADRIPITVNGSYDAIGGVFHSVWLGSGWSEPQVIAAMTGNEAKAVSLKDPNFPAFAPGYAHAVISQGNIILVTWRTDPGLVDNGVWYSFSRIDAPTLPVEPLPTINSNSVLALDVTPIPTLSNIDQNSTPKETDTSFSDFGSPASPVATNPILPITDSITLVVLLLLVVVALRLIQRK
jgi:hypothetical protein